MNSQPITARTDDTGVAMETPAKWGFMADRIGRFGTSARISRPVIERNIAEGMPTITMAGWLGGPAAAQLGYLLNRILNTNGDPGHRHTLFANSTLEAMYAVIRLSRQASRDRRGGGGGHKVLIYDGYAQYRAFFDPLEAGPAAALCPDVRFVDSPAEASLAIEEDRDSLAAVIVIRYPDKPVGAKLQREIDALAEATGALRVACNSEAPIYDPALFKVPADSDVVIFGENLANGEAPFACFCLTERAYATWNTRQSLSTYTSTFYGNSTSLGIALETLRRLTTQVADTDEHVLAQIAGSFETRMEYFARYVHPVFAEMFKAEKADLNILEAKGSHLTLASGRKVMDLSGLGCSLRGHNPADLPASVLDTYDDQHDYLADLTAELGELTAFSRLMPSVSGAGAVDNAITMALLANAPRRKIICLSGNYSGKTLPSVNFSKTAPLLADRDQSAFEPYYPETHYIDPFAEGAAEEFVRLVSEGDVALVWFELIQGYMFKRLPAAIVALVEQHKDAHGYLIGVDEVLTGMWKNGRSILFQQDEMSRVDITTMSKATSDMVFPVSWALVTDDVYRRARATNPRTVRTLEGFYRNNLGAAVALNGIRTARDFFAGNDLTGELTAFHAQLREIIGSSPLFGGVTSEGSLTRLNLDKDWFPYQEGSVQGTLVEGALSKLLLHSTGILLTNLRMFLPSIHGEVERREVVARLTSGLARISPASVCTYMLCQDYELLDMLGMKASFKSSVLAAAAA